MKKAPKLKAPTHRPLKDIHAEYSQLCMKSGDLRHRMQQIPAELENISIRLCQLDKEADVVRVIEKQKAAEEAAQSNPGAPN